MFVRKNILAIIVFTLISISCVRTQDKREGAQIEQIQSLNRNEKDMIVGNWMCCKYGRGLSIINTNQCLKFTFNGDHSGYYLIPSGNKILFEWDTLNDSIISITLNQVKNEIFKKGQYKVVRDKLSQGNKLELINISDEWTYYLVKVGG